VNFWFRPKPKVKFSLSAETEDKPKVNFSVSAETEGNPKVNFWFRPKPKVAVWQPFGAETEFRSTSKSMNYILCDKYTPSRSSLVQKRLHFTYKH